jgi:hypothetical protein
VFGITYNFTQKIKILSENKTRLKITSHETGENKRTLNRGTLGSGNLSLLFSEVNSCEREMLRKAAHNLTWYSNLVLSVEPENLARWV